MNVPTNINKLNEVKDLPAKLVENFMATAGWANERTIEVKI